MNAIDQLWAVAKRRGPIDARRLLDALVAVDPRDVEHADERTKMLVRDAATALRNFPATDPAHADRANALPAFSPPEPDPMDRGFRTLELRLMEPTDPQSLIDLLQDLSRHVHGRCSLTIGGSLSLMIAGLLIRETDDIDVVDEVPAEIREQHDLLPELATDHGLRLAHFQSHYLPDGWQRRIGSIGVFGSITAFRVDPVDVLVGKLFSVRRKDTNDIRLVLPLIERQSFVDRIASSTTRWRADAKLLAAATSNWYVLTGEDTLPPAR